MRVTDVQSGQKVVRFSLRNDSDLPVTLQRAGNLGPKEVSLPAGATVRVSANVDATDKQVELAYTASNFLIGPEKGLPVNLVVAGEPAAQAEAQSAGN